MQYRYVAYTLDAGIVKGRLEAEDEQEARASLLDTGVKPLRISRAIQPPNFGKIFPSLYAVKEAELIAFGRQAATMLASGSNILRALELLEAEAKSRGMRKVMGAIKERVAAGDELSGALREHPLIFDEVFISLVEVGEYTGRLGQALEQLADIMAQQAEAKQRAIKTMMMPVFLIGSSFLMLGFMSFVALPPLLDTFRDMGVEIPLLTRIMTGATAFVVDNFIKLAIGTVTTIIVYKLLRRVPSAKFAIDVVKTRLPLMGNLTIASELGKFTRILATLLDNGVEFPSALALGMNSSKNEALRRAWEDADEALMMGHPVVEALQRHSVLPRMFIELVSVGEETNTLSRTMDELATAYQKQYEDRIEAILAVAEPVSTFAVGGVVLFMAMSVMKPILAASSAVAN